MRKLLWILLLCLPAMSTTRTWDGSTSGKWNEATNWSGDAVPTSGDSAIFNGTGDVACTLDVNATCLALKFAASYTKNFRGTGYTLTTVNGLNDSGTFSKYLPDSIVLTGDGAIRVASSSGGYYGNTTTIDFRGADTLVDNRAITFGRLRVGGTTCRVMGAASSITVSATGSPLILEDNSTLNIAATVTFRRSTNGDLYSIGSNCTLEGTGALNFTQGSGGKKINLPSLTYTGSGAISVRGYSTLDTTIVTGNLVLSGPLNFYSNSATVQHVIDFNDQDITCTVFRFGSSLALTSGYLYHYFGNGTIKCTTFGNVQDSAGAKSSCQIFLEGAKIITAGNVVLPKNDSINPGTSTIWTTTTTSFTSNNQSCYNVRDSLGALTFADAPSLHDFTILSGNSSATTWSGYTMTSDGDVVCDGTGTLHLGNGVTMNGASALFHIGSGVGAVTSTSATFTSNNTDQTFDEDKNDAWKSLIVNNGSLTATGIGNNFLSGSGEISLSLTNSTFTSNTSGIMVFRRNTSGRITAITNSTFNGSGNLNFGNSSGGSLFDTLGKIIYTGTAAIVNIGALGGTTGCRTFILDTASFPNSTVRLTTTATNTTDDTIYLKSVLIGDSVFIGNTSVGSSKITNKIESGAIITAPSISIINTNGTNNFIFGSDIWRLSGTGYLTTNGVKLWDVRNVSGTGILTLADSLQCAYFYDSTGKFDQNSKSLYTDSLYINVSADSALLSGNHFVGGDFYRGPGTIVKQTAGAMYFDTTKQHTLTANGNTLGRTYCKDLTIADSVQFSWISASDSANITFPANVGARIDTLVRPSGSSGKLIRWISSIPGTLARVWVDAFTASYRYFKDIHSKKATINAADGTNVNGGNTQGIDWGCTAPTISYTPVVATRGSAITSVTPTISGAYDSVKAITALPSGLVIDKNNGVLSGTPTVPSALTNYVVRVYACGGSDSAITNLAIAVNDVVPIITSVTPNHGREAGDSVTIRGSNLKYVDSVFFGADVTVDTSHMTDSLIKVVAPSHAAGTVTVIVRNSAGRDTLSNSYTYSNLYNLTIAPLTALDTAGGDTVWFRAEYGLTGAMLLFDAVATPVTVVSDSVAYFVTPAHADGSVHGVLTASAVVAEFDVVYGPRKRRGNVNPLNTSNGLMISTY